MNTSIDSTKVPEVVKKSKELKTKKKSKLTNTGTNWALEKDKPKPKKAAPLLKFLSEDLVEKSLKVFIILYFIQPILNNFSQK